MPGCGSNEIKSATKQGWYCGASEAAGHRVRVALKIDRGRIAMAVKPELIIAHGEELQHLHVSRTRAEELAREIERLTAGVFAFSPATPFIDDPVDFLAALVALADPPDRSDGR